MARTSLRSPVLGASSTAEHKHPRPDSLTGTRSLWTYLAAIFFISFLFQWLAMDRVIGIYDESLDLLSAETVTRGGVPYRDIFTSYGPAQSYVIAALFKLFGTTALIARVYDLLVRSGIVCASAFLVLRAASFRTSLFAAGALLFWLSCPYLVSYEYPVYPALLFALLACCAFLQHLRYPDSRRWLLIGGLAAGVSANFRLDTGFYTWSAQLLLLVWVASSSSRNEQSAPVLRGTIFQAAVLSAGAVLPLLLFFVPVVLAAGWKDTYHDLIYIPAVIYPKVRSLPYPPLSLVVSNFTRHLFSEMDNIVYLPIFVWIAAGITLFETRSSRSTQEPGRDHHAQQPWQRATFLLLFLLDLFLFITGKARVSFVQMMPAILVSLLLLSIASFHWTRTKLSARIPVTVALAWLFLCSLTPLFDVRWNIGGNLRALLQPSRPESFRNTCSPPPGLERARCLIVSPAEAQDVAFIEQNTLPTDRIYVGASHHDKLYINDLRVYFLSGRAPATRWSMLHPGVQTTAEVQSEMVRSLEDAKAKIVVTSVFPPKPEPNASQISSGVTLLDDYIASNYAPQKTFAVPEGSATVLFRKDTPRAGSAPYAASPASK